MGKNKKINIYFIYTILFIIIALSVFTIFFIKSRSFIWQEDGLKQHYIILKDFNEIIRNFFQNPSEGLKLFSWNMGLGSDVIGQYSYYVLGDPFAYISLLFPMQHLEIAYSFLIILRMFCVGISFLTYSKYHKNDKINSVLGAIIYTFSAFALFGGVRHPYFLNAMIIFPMLLLGIDKLLAENKKVFLITWITISAISNYYFFFMHTIMIVIYAIIKYLCEYKEKKVLLKKLGSAILCYIIGILIACIILLPTIYAFLNSSRSGEEVIYTYTNHYYQSVFTVSLLTTNASNWSFIGVSSIILLMIPIFVTRWKKQRTCFFYWIIATVMLLIPFLGSFMNGMSYPNNRWSFIYSFILAYIITLVFDKEYTKKEIKNMLIFLSIYSIFSILMILMLKEKDSCTTIYLMQIIIATIIAIVICYNNKFNHTEKEKYILTKVKIKDKHIIFILSITSIFVMSIGLYSSYDQNYVNEFIKNGEAEKQLSSQLEKDKDYGNAIKEILNQDETNFYRIAKYPHTVQNLSIAYNYYSTESFLSIGTKYAYNLCKDLVDSNYSATSCTRGMSDRTKITTLLGTKYYIVNEENKNRVPYGYQLKQKKDSEASIYENNYPLSIGVGYQEYILRKDYEKLNPLEKEDALLKVAVIDSKDKIGDINLEEKKNLEEIYDSNQAIEYKLIDNDKIIDNNEIRVKKENQFVTLEIPKIKNSELYVYITGLEYKKNNKYTISTEFNGKVNKRTVENKLTSAYYQREPEVLFNLGYYEEAKGEIKLKFSAKGNYEYDKIQVIAVPMDNYETQIKVLQKNELKDVKVENELIKGNINVDKDSIIQISTPYTIGWKAYIDGKEVETFPVNTAFIGFPITNGEHEIILKYEVPFLKLGIILSGLGMTGYIIVFVIEKRKLI